MSPNVEQPQESATPSSSHSEAEAGTSCQDSPRQGSPRPELPRPEPQWSRPAARPKSSPGGRPLRRPGGWDDGEALLVTDVEGEAAGVAGGAWGRDVHAWTPHAGSQGGHDEGDDDEVRSGLPGAAARPPQVSWFSVYERHIGASGVLSIFPLAGRLGRGRSCGYGEAGAGDGRGRHHAGVAAHPASTGSQGTAQSHNTGPCTVPAGKAAV